MNICIVLVAMPCRNLSAQISTGTNTRNTPDDVGPGTVTVGRRSEGQPDGTERHQPIGVRAL
jgi:hypothetical protein